MKFCKYFRLVVEENSSKKYIESVKLITDIEREINTFSEKYKRICLAEVILSFISLLIACENKIGILLLLICVITMIIESAITIKKGLTFSDRINEINSFINERKTINDYSEEEFLLLNTKLVQVHETIPLVG